MDLCFIVSVHLKRKMRRFAGMPRYRRPDAAVPARVRWSGRNYIIVTVSAGKSKPSGRLFQKYTGGIPHGRAAGRAQDVYGVSPV